MTNNAQFVSVTVNPIETDIEYIWLNSNLIDRPLIIFLHEGLGSLSMWKNFPQELCNAINCRGLVYSRPSYGKSPPTSFNEKWGSDFMHDHAYRVLPDFLEALSIDVNNNPPWLFGHSDGGSIALLYASKYPNQLAGAVVLAPHIFVEELTINSIKKARDAYIETDLAERLSKYHKNVDSAFWGWNDVWLDPDFKKWNIHAELELISCPILAVQGRNDEYGTLEQIRAIKRVLPKTELLELDNCSHSPHRDQSEALIVATSRFIRNYS